MNIPYRSSFSNDIDRNTQFFAYKLREHERFEYWADVINKLRNPAEIDSSERKKFHAQINFFDMGDVLYTHSQGTSPFTARRSSHHIAQATKYPFHLIIKQAGGGQVRQGRFNANLSAGDIVLIDTKQDLVSEMIDSKAIVLEIPEILMKAWIPHPEDYVAQVMPSEKGWAAVLVTYLNNLNLNAIKHTRPHHHILIVEHILSIYLLALEETNFIHTRQEISSFHKKDDLYMSMQAWLRKNYMDAEISVTKVSEKFGVSVREVRRQFNLAPNNYTFFETLRSMRLDAAQIMLKDQEFSHLSISEIGYRCGFLDSAYFGRVFKKNINCSPGSFARYHKKSVKLEENNS
ncbi:AraC family transcriptional regulator [Glaciimonas immobilis]|uniref:AraC-like DNA-binding protein n=1 Tax=Glaciimonas immobilis TaxID=728004 RepID=A0A840RQH8_9BURK|nr:AraC family transcriptional regulator [Glaciimonas immobilis]KAF3999271.1 AraC family transcriptional regulator [Glaciimonas immobilis]MBB5198739.1 AraC-like DNA-binding protein [Glaciimonas immobilis]